MHEQVTSINLCGKCICIQDHFSFHDFNTNFMSYRKNEMLVVHLHKSLWDAMMFWAFKKTWEPPTEKWPQEEQSVWERKAIL